MADRSVELHAAFTWTCEDCGRENFARAVQLEPEQVRELVPEDLQDDAEAMREEIGGDWCLAPRWVRCPHCGARYATRET